MGKQWRDCSIACWAIGESYTEMLAPVVHRKGMVEYTSVGEHIVGRWRMSLVSGCETHSTENVNHF